MVGTASCAYALVRSDVLMYTCRCEAASQDDCMCMLYCQPTSQWLPRNVQLQSVRLTTWRERGVACACARYASYGFASAASASEQPMSSAAMRYTCDGFSQVEVRVKVHIVQGGYSR